jgi:hypothetical protein
MTNPPQDYDPPLDSIPPRYLPDPNTYKYERYRDVTIEPDPRYVPISKKSHLKIRTWVKTTIDGKMYWVLEKHDRRSL